MVSTGDAQQPIQPIACSIWARRVPGIATPSTTATVLAPSSSSNSTPFSRRSSLIRRLTSDPGWLYSVTFMHRSVWR